MSNDQIAAFLAGRLQNIPAIKQHVSSKDLLRILSGAVDDWFGNYSKKQKALAKAHKKAETDKKIKFYREQMTVYSELITGLWRLRQKMLDSTGDVPLDAAEAFRKFTAQIWNSLHEAGFRVEENLEELNRTHNVKILSYEFQPGLTEDRIIEIVRPALFHNDVCIQTGQIIIATAVQKDTNDET